MPREVAHEASGKAVAGTGGIDDVLQRIRRHEERPGLVEEDRAVLAALDDDALWASGADFSRSRRHRVLSRELPRLFVVDDEKVDLREHLRENFRLAGDPEVH